MAPTVKYKARRRWIHVVHEFIKDIERSFRVSFQEGQQDESKFPTKRL